MVMAKLKQTEIYILVIVAGLISGSMAAAITVENQNQENKTDNFCKDLGSDLEKNASQQIKEINCHEPGVVTIDDASDDVSVELDCVCSVRNQQDQIRIQPIYRSD
jgi:hypothetical protein